MAPFLHAYPTMQYTLSFFERILCAARVDRLALISGLDREPALSINSHSVSGSLTDKCFIIVKLTRLTFSTPNLTLERISCSILVETFPGIRIRNSRHYSQASITATSAIPSPLNPFVPRNHALTLLLPTVPIPLDFFPVLTKPPPSLQEAVAHSGRRYNLIPYTLGPCLPCLEGEGRPEVSYDEAPAPSKVKAPRFFKGRDQTALLHHGTTNVRGERKARQPQPHCAERNTVLILLCCTICESRSSGVFNPSLCVIALAPLCVPRSVSEDLRAIARTRLQLCGRWACLLPADLIKYLRLYSDH